MMSDPRKIDSSRTALLEERGRKSDLLLRALSFLASARVTPLSLQCRRLLVYPGVHLRSVKSACHRNGDDDILLPVVIRLGAMTEERETTFFVFEVQERGDDRQPIEDVAEEGTEGSVVVPAEDT